LNVVPIPTNKPIRRQRHQTRIFKTGEQKWQGIVQRIIEIHDSGRPVLVGTRSVEASENLSALLVEIGLKHQVLNARQDASEAEIVKQAGQYKQITVATNMAGRGTDIKLPADMVDIGGLHVIATECHEARRIDRQLFGRCGRQGDNGSFELIVSLEDELVKNYCPQPIREIFCLFGSYESYILRLIVNRLVFVGAQKAAERHHAVQRENLLKMDIKLKSVLAFSGSGE